MISQTKRPNYEKGINWREITNKEHFVNRREFMRRTGTMLVGLGVATIVPGFVGNTYAEDRPFAGLPGSLYDTSEKQNTFNQATNYNNYWEFGPGKSDPARNSADFVTSPWLISIGGLVSDPKIVDLDDLILRYSSKLEQRIYRLRCVEAWSMVIPWVGFPLHELIKDCEPNSAARYVRLETLWDPKQMRRAARSIEYPYVEGLRMDEAMNDLTFLAVGMYGDVLPNPNGAPIRLIVPWKYGFKSIKSVRKIEFVAEQPSNTWQKAQPHEYGFYSNVNPLRDHPRWSQRTERRIGQPGRQKTLLFNGYSQWVAGMYTGMDLVNTYY